MSLLYTYSLSKICSKGWVALQGNEYTICAKNFQGLGPKRPESWIANWVYVFSCLCVVAYVVPLFKYVVYFLC